MDIGLTKKVENLKNDVRDFIDNEIRPKEDDLKTLSILVHLKSDLYFHFY